MFKNVNFVQQINRVFHDLWTLLQVVISQVYM